MAGLTAMVKLAIAYWHIAGATTFVIVLIIF